MKIAVVNDFFPPHVVGGADLFLGKLCDYLSERNEIVVITSHLVEGKPNFKTYKIKSSPFQFSHLQQIPGFTLPWLLFNRSLKHKLKNIYRDEKIDLVYLNNFYHLSFAPLQAALDLKIKTILDVHDYWPICFSKDKYRNNTKTCNVKEGWKCSFCLAKKFSLPFLPLFSNFLSLEKALKKKLLKRVSKFLCHSKFMKEKLLENGYKSKAIPYPYFGKVSKQSKKTEEFRILFVGRLTEKKGADLILPLASNLIGKTKFRIDVIGKGPLLENLDRKNLNIYTHGFMGEKRFEYFKKADCLLAPSRWPEPFGIVALEAMAYGLPVVTLDKSGGLKDLIRENETGVVSKEEDLSKEVMSLIEDRNKRLKNNCRLSIKKYEKNKLFKKYENFLKSLD